MNSRPLSPSPALPLALFLFIPLFLLAALAHADPPATDIKDPSISGGVADGKVRITVEGQLDGRSAAKDKLLFTTSLEQTIKATRDKLTNTFALTIDILQGDPKEIPFAISGEGEIKQVTGDALLDWSIRQEPGGGRTLLLRPKKTVAVPAKPGVNDTIVANAPPAKLAVTILVERDLKTWKTPLVPLTLTPPQPVLFSGFVKIESVPELDLQPDALTGLLPIEAKFLPESMRGGLKPEDAEPLAYQFHGTAYTIPLKITVADPETRQVVLRDFKLTGTLTEPNAAFVLTATARVLNPRGGTIAILSGGLALTELPQHPDWHLTADKGRFVIVFDKPGDFPIQFKFNAAVRQNAISVGTLGPTQLSVCPPSSSTS